MAFSSFRTKIDLPSATILHRATVDLDFVTIEKIIKYNKGWRANDDNGETVLHLTFKRKAIIFDDEQRIIQTLECFLDNGISVNVKNAAGRTVLFPAIENRFRDVIEFLVKRGADLNTRDQNGCSIVHFLIKDQLKKYSDYCIINDRLDARVNFEQEDIDFMIWLLSKGVNVDCRNNEGKTAFHLAIECNLQHVMPVLIRYINNVNCIDKDKCTIIELFLKLKSISMDVRPGLKPTYIHNSHYRSRYDVDIAKCLLNNGVSVDNVDKKGNTLVHTFLKLHDRNPNVIRCMLQHYTKINAQDRDGNTALHLVIDNGISRFDRHEKDTIDFVRILLSKGADVHLQNNFGDTPVRQAVRIKHTEVLNALLEHGADLSPFKHAGDFLLHEISIKRELGFDDKLCAPMVDMLVRAGWDVNAIRPDDYYTPLMEACRFNCPEIVKKLIAMGANVHYAEKRNHMRPIHMVASACGNETNLFKILARAGADVNVQNIRGETVLYLAAGHDYFTIKTLLLDLGADVNISDVNGRLPLYEAIKERNLEGIRTMLEFGADVNDEGVFQEIEALVNFRNNVEHIVDYLIKQWIKLKVANLPATNSFAVLANKKDHQKFCTKCLEEVQTLKRYYLDDRVTLYHLLHMDVHLKCVFIANNDMLRNLVRSPSLRKTFPEYHVLILARYNMAVARNPLIKPAKLAWYYLTGINLPDICVRQILVHMKNEDLRIMAEELKKINFLKRSNQLSLDDLAKKKRLT